MARTKSDEQDIDVPPLANTIFAGDVAADRLASQGITGPQSALAHARMLKKQGASADVIHRETSKMLDGTPYAGVHFGADGKPRFEISDRDARVKPLKAGDRTTMGQFLDHPELYRANPDAQFLEVTKMKGRGASYDGNTVALGENMFSAKTVAQYHLPNASAKQAAIHELQHDVQSRNGMAQGGSPDDFKKKLPGDANEAMRVRMYKSLAGEQEAEMARARTNMTPEERRATPPKPEVPFSEQIVTDTRGKVVEFNKAVDVDGKKATLKRLDPRRIKADPDTFQFKAGGDHAGVTDRLKTVKKWDPVSAGKAIVFQKANGEHVIADGHQRRGLALRAVESGQKGVKMDAYVFRERDGWTASDVRAIAAMKNIREDSGTALDMAKVMRERPDMVDGTIPMSSSKVKEARGLANLSKDAFGMVAGGAVKPEIAAAVGEQMRDQSRHADMLKEMAKAKVSTAQHARLYVAQAVAAPQITETTGSLFGTETQQRSLLAERAAVLNKAMDALRSDKRIFGMLEREAGTVEGAGNKLARTANADRADTAARMGELVEKLATMKGPVSEMLDRAARAVAEGQKPATAARSLVTDMRSAMKSGGVAALTGSGPAGWSDAAREASAKVRGEKAAGPKAKGGKRVQRMVDDGWTRMPGDDAPRKQIKTTQEAAAKWSRILDSIPTDPAEAKRIERRNGEALNKRMPGRVQMMADEPKPSERKYHIDVINDRTGKSVRMSSSPMTHKEALTVKSKMMDFKWRRTILVEDVGGQASFLPDATTKEQIAAAAKSKGKPSVAQQDVGGLFGDSHKQMDIVEMAKTAKTSPAQSTTVVNSETGKPTTNAEIKTRRAPRGSAKMGKDAAGMVKESAPANVAGVNEAKPSGKPAGWSDAAREASAEVRKEDAVGKKKVAAPRPSAAAAPKKSTPISEKLKGLSKADLTRIHKDVVGAAPKTKLSKAGILSNIEGRHTFSVRTAARVIQANGLYRELTAADDARIASSTKEASAKFHEKLDKSIAGLRGTQNEANRDAIIKNRKANAKGKAAPYGQAKPDTYSTGREAPSGVQSESARAKRVSKSDVEAKARAATASMSAAAPGADREARINRLVNRLSVDGGDPAALRAKAEKMIDGRGTPIPPRPADIPAPVKVEKPMERAARELNEKRRKGDAKPAFQAPDPMALIDKRNETARSHAEVAKATGNTSRAEIGKALVAKNDSEIARLEKAAKPAKSSAAKKAIGLLAPVAIGTAMLAGANQAKAAGTSEAKGAAVEGAKATGALAAFAAGTAVVTGGMIKAGLTAAKAIPLTQGLLMVGGAGVGAYQARGEGLSGMAKGAAKGAWDMSLPGMVVNTGLEAKHAIGDRMKGFDKANADFSSGMKAQRDAPSQRKKGWGPEARIAAAQARGVENLPYGGNPEAAPNFAPKKAKD